jgi:hypothetical protein
MKIWARVLVCVVVAIITVPVAIVVSETLLGRNSDAIVGLSGAFAVFLAWSLTSPKGTPPAHPPQSD